MVPHKRPQSPCLWKKEKNKITLSQGQHVWSVVVPMVRGGPLFPPDHYVFSQLFNFLAFLMF